MRTNDISIVHTFVDEQRDKARAWFANEWSETHRLPVGNKPPFLWANDVAISEFMLAIANINLEASLAVDRLAASAQRCAVDRVPASLHVGTASKTQTCDEINHGDNQFGQAAETSSSNSSQSEDEGMTQMLEWLDDKLQADSRLELQESLYPTDISEWN